MKENCENKCCEHQGNHTWKHGRGPAGCGAIYGLGFIGAAVFFIGHATTFWAGVLGIFQAMVWPAFLVYEAFKFLIK